MNIVLDIWQHKKIKKSSWKKVKELYVRLELRHADFPVKDMACSGCKPENNCTYKEVRSCVYGKGYENCGLCDAYPCELITTAFDKSEKTKSKAVRLCNNEEMNVLQKAFFSKKEYFDRRDNKNRKKI